MTTLKRITDLTQYAFLLPCATEMFGVHQPLLGWRSKWIENCFNQGFQNDRLFLLNKLKRQFVGVVDINYKENNQVDIQIRPGKEKAAIHWVKGVEGMNGIAHDVICHASNAVEKDVKGNPL